MRKKAVLEKLYGKYNRFELIEPDPLQFVYKYSDPRDMEVVAFLSAGLAYGRVAQIERSLLNLFGRMGESPNEFVRDFSDSSRERLRDFKHRFTTGQDISDLVELLSRVLRRFGNLEEFFLRGYNESDESVIGALSRFCDSLCQMHAKRHGSKVSEGVRYLLASPERGSASKRLNLFLRWMVRSDDVDVGLWKSIDKSKLIVPVDVHMGRLCRILGLYDCKTVSLSAALKITESFAEIEPSDPVKYDFALSRIGIVGDCNGQYRKECEFCELYRYCLRREGWAI